MSCDEFCAANRRNWDERVAIHRRDATGFYGIERFLAGEKQLYAIDSGELGEIAPAQRATAPSRDQRGEGGAWKSEGTTPYTGEIFIPACPNRPEWRVTAGVIQLKRAFERSLLVWPDL
jgi:hypothetical protein